MTGTEVLMAGFGGQGMLLAGKMLAHAAMTQGLGGGGGDFTITVELHDVTASNDHVVALVKAHATRGDAVLDYNTAEIFHVRDGKISERWAFSDDTARITAFFA